MSSKYAEVALAGAMTDPCPVCQMKPSRGVNVQGTDADPREGAFTVCYGCGLVQIIRDGMRCALSEAQADWVFEQPDMICSLVAIAKLRAQNPWRVGDIVRKQKEAEGCPDCGGRGHTNCGFDGGS